MFVFIILCKLGVNCSSFGLPCTSVVKGSQTLELYQLTKIQSLMNDEYQSAKVLVTPFEENHKDRFNNVPKPLYSFDKYAPNMDLD